MTTTTKVVREHYSTGEICVVHASCSGEESDCRTERGTRPMTTTTITTNAALLNGEPPVNRYTARVYAVFCPHCEPRPYPNADEGTLVPIRSAGHLVVACQCSRCNRSVNVRFARNARR